MASLLSQQVLYPLKASQWEGPLHSLDSFKAFLVEHAWVPGETLATGRTVSGELALRALVEARANATADGVDTRLRQLAGVLKAEKPHHRSPSDAYWLATLIDHIPPRYAKWEAVMRRIRGLAGTTSANSSFAGAWASNPELLALPPMLGGTDGWDDARKALEGTAKDLYDVFSHRKDLFTALESDGTTPTLWAWLTRPGVAQANNHYPLVWDWDLLLKNCPLDQHDWNRLLAHPLAPAGIMATGFALNSHPHRVAQDEALLPILQQAALQVGMNAGEGVKGNEEEIHAFLTQLQRGLALDVGLPSPSRSSARPRF